MNHEELLSLEADIRCALNAGDRMRIEELLRPVLGQGITTMLADKIDYTERLDGLLDHIHELEEALNNAEQAALDAHHA